MTLHLRPVSNPDLKEIHRINKEVQSIPWSENDILSEIKQNCRFSSVACDGSGKIQGYLFVRPSGPDHEIISIGVAKNAQRQGVGSHLLRGFLERISTGSEVYLEVSHRNASAMALYMAFGFTQIGIRKAYYRDGSDAVCMKLSLANP
jgi:[ribosomal protein S18]-alanine N-acetyltransferase